MPPGRLLDLFYVVFEPDGFDQKMNRMLCKIYTDLKANRSCRQFFLVTFPHRHWAKAAKRGRDDLTKKARKICGQQEEYYLQHAIVRHVHHWDR